VSGDLVQKFSQFNHFFVDFKTFSSIIYILYEGGWLRPPVVRPSGPAFQLSESKLQGGRMAKKGGKKKGGKKR
jgi:hypothetical protein